MRTAFPKRLCLAAGFLAAGAAPGLAVEDPIAVRQALMDSVAASAAVSGGVSKGEIAYSPAIGRGAIMALDASAQAFGDYFPDGTDGVAVESSTASPRIWEDHDGFRATLAKFREAAGAAKQAAGEEGPSDAEAFTAAVQPVLGTCRTCHESYRIKK